MNLSAHKSGDIIMFSGNLLTGNLLKFFTDSKWNHAGIIVWIDESNGRKIITENSGSCCVLEINSSKRIDRYTGQLNDGIGFSYFYDIINKYHSYSIRQMNDEMRTTFINNVIPFFKSNSKLKYSKTPSKFINCWLGIEKVSDIDNDGVFCTEMMAICYSYCFRIEISKIMNLPNLVSELCVPNIYSPLFTPNSKYFSPYLINVRIRHEKILSTLVIVLALTIVVVLLIILVMLILSSCRGKYITIKGIVGGNKLI